MSPICETKNAFVVLKWSHQNEDIYEFWIVHLTTSNIIPRLDLGLLVVLVAIADAGSVSAAASRLNLSQPAVSHSLKRLRELTGDQLFFRESGKLRSSNRVQEILPIARNLIETATKILGPQDFNPNFDIMRYRFGVRDYGQRIILPKILEHFRDYSDNILFDVQPIAENSLEMLEDGKIDFLLTGDRQEAVNTDKIVSVPLFSENYIGVMHQKHPLANSAQLDSVSIDDWIAYPHVRSIPRLLQNPKFFVCDDPEVV
jgi:DNA-binding transcriptional LysR family regulator